GGSSVKVGRRNPNLNQLPPVTPITYTTSWDTTSMPASQLSEFRLNDVTVQYGEHDPLATTKPAFRATGDSGSCHTNVQCPVGENWSAAVRSTVLLVIGNQILCTGVLVNNAEQDERPLLMTADHCQIRQSDSDGGYPPESVIAVFKFQSAQCGSNVGQSALRKVFGERLLFRDPASDVSLPSCRQGPLRSTTRTTPVGMPQVGRLALARRCTIHRRT
ncbi:MAG: hypothetical protein MRY71_10995, partial [Algiphilus sp.]|nr:hypothetical protein [Algiphilus sp.]